jgi:PAS domain S-box-containing protein
MALWEMDADTGAMWWSEEAERLLGVPAGATGGQARLPHVVQRLHPADRPAFQSAVARAVASPGEVQTVQARVDGPEDRTRWLEVRGVAWADDRGRLEGLRGSLVDVTELKRVEEELRRRLEEQRVVGAVAQAAASSPDEDALLAAVTALVRDSFFPDNCGFLVLDESNGVLHHARSFHSRRPADELAPIPLGKGIVGNVARSGAPRRIDDVLRDPDYLALDPEMRSEICVPLRAGERVLGVFDAESTRPAAFTEEDERLLEVVVGHAVSAVERLRAVEALRESNEMYRAYFTGSPLAVFVSDARGRYLDVNGAACALTGYRREELLTRSISDLLPPDQAAALGERLLGLMALGGGRNEIEIRHRDGSPRFCVVQTSVVGSDRLLGLLLDVTDRREAEAKLRESEERFRSLSEAAFEAILIHESGRIVDVNDALCKLSGYSWHELVGRDGFELLAPEFRESTYRNLLAELDRPYEVECVKRDGTRMPVELQARSFSHRGQVLRVVALRDVSERRKAEAVRESLIRELEGKNAELERFGYGVTHDLKAPLLTVRGFADYLDKDVREGRIDRVVADAARIKEAVSRLEEKLGELVDQSRAARAVGPPVAVPAEDLVREAWRLLAEGVTARDVRIEVAGPLPVVFGDRARLVQVFQSLLWNAVRMAPGGGQGLVRVEGRAARGGEAVFVVRDNGPGEDAEGRGDGDRPPRLDEGTAGPGVGLGVARRIVAGLGMRLWAESDGATGGAVCVSLPTPPASSGASDPLRSPTEGARRLPE